MKFYKTWISIEYEQSWRKRMSEHLKISINNMKYIYREIHTFFNVKTYTQNYTQYQYITSVVYTSFFRRLNLFVIKIVQYKSLINVYLYTLSMPVTLLLDENITL